MINSDSVVIKPSNHRQAPPAAHEAAGSNIDRALAPGEVWGISFILKRLSARQRFFLRFWCYFPWLCRLYFSNCAIATRFCCWPLGGSALEEIIWIRSQPSGAKRNWSTRKSKCDFFWRRVAINFFLTSISSHPLLSPLVRCHVAVVAALFGMQRSSLYRWKTF